MRAALRRAAAASVVLCCACAGVAVGPDPGTGSSELFERVWRDLDRHYSLFAVRGVDWDSLHAAYAARAARAYDDWILATTISRMLAELKDVHVNLFVNGLVMGYSDPRAAAAPFDRWVVRGTYVPDMRVAPGRTLEYGRVASDVGYVRIPSFGPSGLADDVDAALADLAPLRALVVDLRLNSGGVSQHAVAAAARFADRERTFAYVRYRDGPRRDDFTPRSAVTVAPAGASRFTGPVVVAVNRSVMSAAEHFVLAMDALPAVTLVGDTTAGALGSPLTRELPNGWTYRFPQWIEYTAGGECLEGVGIAPDVVALASNSELGRGKDAVLDSALAVALRALPARGPAAGALARARPPR